jgi:hypothetical protein
MKKMFGVLILLTAALLSLSALPAVAHEEREVGSYDMELGWRVEPAYTTLLNGPEIFVHKHDTGDAVDGLEDTLQLTVSYGGRSKTLKLRAVEGDTGHYTADLIPTQPGDYSFHVTGKIEDSDIDETFTSADGKFGSVDPVSDIQFP